MYEEFAKTIQELQESPFSRIDEGLPTEQFSELVQKKCNRLAIWTTLKTYDPLCSK